MKYSFFRFISLLSSFIPYLVLTREYDVIITAVWFKFLLLENIFLGPLISARNINCLKSNLYPFPKYFDLIVIFSSFASVFLFIHHGYTEYVFLISILYLAKWRLNTYQIYFIRSKHVFLLEIWEKIIPSVFLGFTWHYFKNDFNVNELLVSYFSVSVLVLIIVNFSLKTKVFFGADKSINFRQYSLAYLQAFSAQGDQLLASLFMSDKVFIAFRLMNLILRNIYSIATAQSIFHLHEIKNWDKDIILKKSRQLGALFVFLTLIGQVSGYIVLTVGFTVDSYFSVAYLIFSISYLFMAYFAFTGTVLNAFNEIYFLQKLKIATFFGLNISILCAVYFFDMSINTYAILFGAVHSVASLLQFRYMRRL